jgi:hypothetical protein
VDPFTPSHIREGVYGPIYIRRLVMGGNTSSILNKGFHPRRYILKCVKGNKELGYKKGKELICKSVYVAFWRRGTKVWRVMDMDGSTQDYMYENWQQIQM